MQCSNATTTTTGKRGRERDEVYQLYVERGVIDRSKPLHTQRERRTRALSPVPPKIATNEESMSRLSDDGKMVLILPGTKNLRGIEYCRNETIEHVECTDDMEEIGKESFKDCTLLKSIALKPGLRRIGDFTFIRCTRLMHVSFVDGMNEIGDSTFALCTLLTSVELKSGLERIGSQTFQGCTRLTNVAFVEGMEEIGRDSFQGCTSLKSIELKPGLKKIGAHTFGDCAQLTHVSFVDGMDEIGDYSFTNCTALKSITLRPGDQTIGLRAFWGCSQLTAIVVPFEYLPTSLDSNQVAACDYPWLMGQLRVSRADHLQDLIVSRPLTCPEMLKIETRLFPEACTKELFMIRKRECNIARSLQVFMLMLRRNLKWTSFGRVGIPILRYWFRGTRRFPLDTRFFLTSRVASDCESAAAKDSVT